MPKSELQSAGIHYRVGMVAKLTGISAHTLRMWERRYAAVAPSRRKGGARTFSDADVARLRRLKTLVDRGHAIGQIAHLTEQQLSELGTRESVVPALHSGEQLGDLRQKILEAIKDLNAREAEMLMRRAAAVLEPRTFLIGVMDPVLREMGELWQRGELRIVHEHTASALLRSLIGSLSFAQVRPETGKRALLCTPVGESHEFGVLMATVLARSLGVEATYLGTELPVEDIVHALETTGAQFLLLSVVQQPSEETRSELVTLAQLLPRSVSAFIGGRGSESLEIEGLRRIERLDDLTTYLK